MEIDKKELKAWLKSIPDGRKWLAGKTGQSPKTVDGWCSTRAIPAPVAKIIGALMSESKRPESHLVIPFTADEYALIIAASDKGGFRDVTDFGRTALKELADNILDSSEKNPQPNQIALLAEHPRTYSDEKRA